MKIVINGCYGGFGLSHEAIMEYAKRKGITLHARPSEQDRQRGVTDPAKAFMVEYLTVPPEEYDRQREVEREAARDGSGRDFSKSNAMYWSHYDIERTDPILVAMIEEDEEGKYDGPHASLHVVEIPDGVNWEIDEYDGIESIHETHRSWA